MIGSGFLDDCFISDWLRSQISDNFSWFVSCLFMFHVKASFSGSSNISYHSFCRTRVTNHFEQKILSYEKISVRNPPLFRNYRTSDPYKDVDVRLEFVGTGEPRPRKRLENRHEKSIYFVGKTPFISKSICADCYRFWNIYSRLLEHVILRNVFEWRYQ